MTEPIRVWLVNEDSFLRQTVSNFLQRENIIVSGEADSGGELLRKITGGARPDAVLIDVDLPDLPGIEVSKQLQKVHPALPVICLSFREEVLRIQNTVRLPTSSQARPSHRRAKRGPSRGFRRSPARKG
ncbi:MAG: response regulator [Caldilinea sp. CFX5]|nr:response regulator [Caldilinea sp. CFX5]